MSLLWVMAISFVFILIMTLTDVWFLIRQGLHYCALLWQKPPQDIFEPFVLRNLVLTTDLDYMLHMNNARYLREANFATCTFLTRYGLAAALKTLGGSAVLSASCSRHRRPLRLLERFNIRTRILGWDDHAFYLEQLFRHPNGFVVAVVLCRHHITGTTPAALIAFIAQNKVESPELPEEVKHWLKYNEANSQRLRAESNNQKNEKEQ
ncbi:PREDICTED: protein THEM6-like isoform X2 [Gekko japonicus]|uniref:Protein THEM6 n=1 Tax=Gekko japonicus TaxID=146911 RepID=A0ABM1K7D2_GEKJA|nr:PREDICTED: protein THEM6-like isoform X2 [Gekko japonicus]